MEVYTSNTESTCEGVNIEWPFVQEAIGEATEIHSDRIQEAIEIALEYADLPDSPGKSRAYLKVGYEVMHQLVKYILEVKHMKENDDV